MPVPGKKVQDEAEQKANIDREQANELEYVDESQKSEATESANASSGSAGAKPVRNPEREKPKWEDTITNRDIQCLSPAKKHKLYKSSINKSIHFVQMNNLGANEPLVRCA